tara:strand:+ start:18 stop:509 length:492 start_codon:yes stop_codon:yes gene_type:complete
MQFKKYTKQRNVSIQGLRSFKDTLPKNIKKIINKKGHIFSETLNNWKYIAGDNLFKICFPKSFRSSSKFRASTLVVMVKRGHEVDLEYSKKKILERLNNLLGSTVVEKLKFTSFDEEIENTKKQRTQEIINVTKNKYHNKIINVKNDKIKKSLFELTKVFKKK